jgi:hypothetical protein
VTVVGGMTVTIMHVVHVVIMRHGDMSAPRTVLVRMPVVHRVLHLLALVGVVAVHAVDVTVVRVVDVIAVRDRDMPAAVTVHVPMACMRAVIDGGLHGRAPHVPHRTSRRPINSYRH